jgi:hypothetical protein
MLYLESEELDMKWMLSLTALVALVVVIGCAGVQSEQAQQQQPTRKRHHEYAGMVYEGYYQGFGHGEFSDGSYPYPH